MRAGPERSETSVGTCFPERVFKGPKHVMHVQHHKTQVATVNSPNFSTVKQEEEQ